jgi:hypothetical protein
VHDAEIEASRKAAWLLHWSEPEHVNELAAHSFSPSWIQDMTPLDCWPPGDGSENHYYSAVAPPVEPEDDGVVPPLLIRARQMGLDV